MLKTNATLPAAPFRKNTLGNKIISSENEEIKTIHRIQLNGYDCQNEEYNHDLNNKLDAMHESNIQRLQKNGYTSQAIDIYSRHFIRGVKIKHFTETEQKHIKSIREFLISTKKTLLDD
jgi:hypothetical protein